MKKIWLFAVPFVLAFAIGCSGGDAEAGGDVDNPTQKEGKAGEKMEGISADQVGVTGAGQKADSTTGSQLGED